VETLGQVGVQKYTWPVQGTGRWRTTDERPPASLVISSPYDRDAHYSQKWTTSWGGDNVQLSASCDDDLPHLITDGQPPTAPVSDDAVTPANHAALEQRDLLAAVHLVDSGCIDADLLVESEREYQVDLVGPVRGDDHRQAQEGQGFAAPDFMIDFTPLQATCPAGKSRSSWTPAVDQRTNEVLKLKFSMRDGKGCEHRVPCTEAPRRTIPIRPEEQYRALQRARVRQERAEFKEVSAHRSGREGTLSQGVRVSGLRQARSVGEGKPHLQHLATATAINLARVSDWLDERPRAPTRPSQFERLDRKAA
jgi:transposase